MSSRLPSIYHTLTPPRNYNLENLEFLSRISMPIPRSAPIPLFHTKKTAEAVLCLRILIPLLLLSTPQLNSAWNPYLLSFHDHFACISFR